jgi:putative oxidoreductase
MMTLNVKNGVLGRLYGWHQTGFQRVSNLLGGDALPLLARLALAGVFWRSLLTKVEVTKLFPYTELINDFAVQRHHVRVPSLPLDIKASTFQIFETEYALPLIPVEWATWMATLAEFLLPLLLVFGLLTRLSAAALLGMTVVIQLFVYPDAWWATHALWAVMAVYLAVQGPGRISADHLARRFFAP